MRFAICNETFQDRSVEEGFDFAAECGYEGIEIAPFTLSTYAHDISSARRTEVRRAAERAGLEVVGLHWLLAKTEGFHLTSPDAAVRAKTADYLGALVDLCAELGGRVMVLGSPQQRNLLPGVSAEQATDFALEVLASLGPQLEQGGVTLALEPLAPAETNFLTTAAEAMKLIDRIGHPQVRLHLDCKAMASEAVPIPELIRRYHAAMAHFHANDPNRQGPGFGQLDFVPIFVALSEVGYRGWVSVEVFDYTPGVEALARDSIAYMKQCFARLDSGN